MAAERAQRKQCVFRRAFQRFPFGKCERKSRGTSSYDVFHKESSQHTVEKWLPNDPTPLAHGSPQTPTICSQMQLRSLDPAQTPNAMEVGVSSLDHSPQGPCTRLQRVPSDSMQICVNIMGPPELNSECHTGSQQAEGPLVQAAPPSPSLSSMDTDMEVDPETGERALG